MLLLGFTGFLLDLTRLRKFFLHFNGLLPNSSVIIGLYWVLLGFTGFLLDLTRLRKFFCTSTDCYQILVLLLGYTGFYWVLLGFTGFLVDLTSFHQVM